MREFENRIPRDQIEARCHTIPPGGIRAVPGHEAWTAEETVCSICIAPVEEPGSVACLLDCRHAFHLDCVESWLHTNATCPNCRCAVGVATEEVEDEEEPSSDAEDAGGGSDAIPGGRNAASGAAARESLAEALGPFGPEVLDASEAFAVQMERFMDPDAEIPSDEERRMCDAFRVQPDVRVGRGVRGGGGGGGGFVGGFVGVGDGQRGGRWRRGGRRRRLSALGETKLLERQTFVIAARRRPPRRRRP